MAQVFRADDTLLRREVAIKLLYRHLLRDPQGKARFVREARAAAALDHPGILKVFDVDEGDEGGVPYIVMELLRGQTLKAFIDANGAPLAELVALAGAGLAAALATAHAAGVIHRDVKPANVMCAGGGRLVLCDFGVARLLDDDALATQSGMVLGTPAYMAPEQALGKKVDERSDVYSLGATLYQMATGVPPFAGTSSAVIQDVLRGRFIPALRRNPTIGIDLAAVIDRAMAREPDARYQTARELQVALEEVAAGARLDARELTGYFADPGAWNQETKPRIVAATMARAKEAAASKKTARALALAERVLAFDQAHAEANSLIARLGVATRRRHQGTWLVGGAAVLAVVGLGAAQMMRSSVVVAVADAAVPERTGYGLPATGGDGSVPVPDAAPALAPVAVAVPDAAPVRVAVRRRPDAAVVPEPEPVPVPVSVPAPVVAEPATLEVKIRPWCDITVDGVGRGRSPNAPAISLEAGKHTLRCEQTGQGRAYQDVVELAAGERKVVAHDLLGEVAVTIAVPSARVVIDGKTVTPGGTVKLTPGRHRVELRRGEALVGTAYVHIPTGPCTLRDVPDLACYE